MLVLVGLGLNDEGDVTLKAIEELKHCDKVCCELYTNKWQGNIEKLSHLIGKPIAVLSRSHVESDVLIHEAKKYRVALLVSGDPLSATTHYELLAACRAQGIETRVVHASSIFTAVAETGLDLYKFGRTTTLVFPSKSYHPQSPYDMIAQNKAAGLHTLVLLDIQEEAKTYMTVHQALELIMQQETLKTIAAQPLFACCGLGSTMHVIRYGTCTELLRDASLTQVPAVLVIPGILSHKEQEYAEWYRCSKKNSNKK
ncbi:MAG: diphthine synthase [Candidatus Aenigmarchaeota archaeon]|nr:diphthine synthase [Candidatus Aenigmarchaeota archaeon]